MKLEYFISEKEKLVVLSFRGNFSDYDPDLLNQCLDEALASSPLGVVLHMGEVDGIPKSAFRPFTFLLRGLKAKGILVLVSSKPTDSSALIQAGLLTSAEVRANLPDAVRDLAAQIKGLKP